MSAPTLVPTRDLGNDADLQATSIAPGVKTSYGTTTWIPDNYPQGMNRPYVQDDGRILIRPLAFRISSDPNHPSRYYLLAALQAAVNQYSSNPYDVNYDFPNNVASGLGDIESSLAWGTTGAGAMAAPVARRTGSWNGDINWAVPPPNPSGWETFGGLAAKYIPALTNAALNIAVPGLGTQLAKMTGTAVANPSTGQIVQTDATQTAQYQNALLSAGNKLENQLLAGYQTFVNEANSNPAIKIGAIVVIVIIIVLLFI